MVKHFCVGDFIETTRDFLDPNKILISKSRRIEVVRSFGWEEMWCKFQKYSLGEVDLPSGMFKDDAIAAGIFDNLRRQSYTREEEIMALFWLKRNFVTFIDIPVSFFKVSKEDHASFEESLLRSKVRKERKKFVDKKQQMAFRVEIRRKKKLEDNAIQKIKRDRANKMREMLNERC